jgi:hypothetical protein
MATIGWILLVIFIMILLNDKDMYLYGELSHKWVHIFWVIGFILIIIDKMNLYNIFDTLY